MLMADMTSKTMDVILAIVLTFLIVGNLAGTIIVAAGNISGSGLPLASLFGASGIALIIFMVGILRRIMKAAN